MNVSQLPPPPFRFDMLPAGLRLSRVLPGGGTVPWEAIYQEVFRRLPGNTAKAHGRGFTTWLFFRFAVGAPDPARQLRTFLRTCLAHGWHTSLENQLVQRRAYQLRLRELGREMRTADEPSAPFGAVLLTRRTLERLYPFDFRRAFMLQDRSFRCGMPANCEELGDGPSLRQGGAASWTGYGYEKEFDLGLLLADTSRANVNALVQEATMEAGRCHLAVVQSENGFRWQPDGPHTPMKEPFGFRDGLSNLLFMQEDIDQQFAQGPVQWNAAAGWEQAFFDVPGSTDPLTQMLAGGSFVVLRKLEQDVDAFRTWEQGQGGGTDPGRQVTGRLRDGCPMAGLPASGRLNDFNYQADPAGHGCPYHAHVRRANPRGDSVKRGSADEAEERSRLFVRRGMIYAKDDRLLLTDRPTSTTPATREEGVGLLFTGYMGRIDHQFLHMNNVWLLRRDFPVGTQSTMDGLISRGPDNPTGRTFVIPRGGGYFFTPPITWIEGLAP